MARADVIIVGGGLMGCGAAWELAKHGARVTVLERSVPGAEASSAAAGILGAQVETHASGAMAELCLASRAEYPGWAAALTRETCIDVEYRQTGAMRVVVEASEAAELRSSIAWQRRRKLRANFLTVKKLRALEPALTGAAAAVEFPDDARVAPRRLFRALHLAALAAGVQFRSGSYVQALDIQAGRARGVKLEDGDILGADWVVMAAGSWTTLIPGVPLPRPSVIPARGQMLQLRCRRPPLGRVVFGPGCYLVPRDDGRVLVGSTLEFVGFEKRVTAGAVRDLLGAATRLVPELSDAELEDHWSNFRPYTPDHAPVLGPCDVERLILATGHHRNGILLTPITAQIVSACVRGVKPPLPLADFSPGRVSLTGPSQAALSPLPPGAVRSDNVTRLKATARANQPREPSK